MTVKRDVVKLYFSEMAKLKKELTVAGQRVSLTLIVGLHVNKSHICALQHIGLIVIGV